MHQDLATKQPLRIHYQASCDKLLPPVTHVYRLLTTQCLEESLDIRTVNFFVNVCCIHSSPTQFPLHLSSGKVLVVDRDNSCFGRQHSQWIRSQHNAISGQGLHIQSEDSRISSGILQMYDSVHCKMLTILTAASSRNSMKANFIAELGSPHTRQSTTLPHS